MDKSFSFNSFSDENVKNQNRKKLIIRMLSVLIGFALLIPVCVTLISPGLSLENLNMERIQEEKIKFSDINGDESYAPAVDILSALKIFDGYRDGTFRAENNMLRSEVTAIIIRLLDLETEARVRVKTDYEDVAERYWASGYIKKATELGIVTGDEGKFSPERNIKFEEAVKMLVIAAGYGEEAVEAGGYPYGYIKIAEDKKILDNITAKKGDIINRGTVAQLTYQTILSQLNDISVSVEGGKYLRAQKVSLTSLSKNAEIYYTLDGSTPTEESALYEDEILIDKPATLKAVAILKGMSSGTEIFSQSYVIFEDIRGDNPPLKLGVKGN